MVKTKGPNIISETETKKLKLIYKVGRNIHLKITKEEKIAILVNLAKYELNASELARRVDVERSTMSLFLSGQRGLNQYYCNKIYEILKKDPSLNFLLYNGNRGQQAVNVIRNTHRNKDQDTASIVGSTADHWGSLYNCFTTKLKGFYDSADSEKKGKILGELERMVTDYCSKNE